MSTMGSRKSLNTRKQHNLDLIKRMRNGEALTRFDSRASWFPPRPIIKKDPEALARLYRQDIDKIKLEEV